MFVELTLCSTEEQVDKAILPVIDCLIKLKYAGHEEAAKWNHI
jgi:hypothetical protein